MLGANTKLYFYLLYLNGGKNMNKKTYRIIAIITLDISGIGLLSFIGGIKPVNIGAFVFPLLVSGIFFWLYGRHK